MSSVPCYDTLPATPVDGDPSVVKVERIYCLDFDCFEAHHWQALDVIYRSLPGGYRARQVPSWFGGAEEEGVPPFLGASVEPPGLQVYGMLPLSEWLGWDAAFKAALDASGLPMRRLH